MMRYGMEMRKTCLISSQHMIDISVLSSSPPWGAHSDRTSSFLLRSVQLGMEASATSTPTHKPFERLRVPFNREGAGNIAYGNGDPEQVDIAGDQERLKHARSKGVYVLYPSSQQLEDSAPARAMLWSFRGHPNRLIGLPVSRIAISLPFFEDKRRFRTIKPCHPTQLNLGQRVCKPTNVYQALVS